MDATRSALAQCASAHAAAAALGHTDSPTLSLLRCLAQCFAPPPPPPPPALAALRERLFSALHANPERLALPKPHLRQAYLAVACLEAALLLAPQPLPPPDAAAAAAQALRALDTAQLLAGPDSPLLQALTAAALAAAAAAAPPPYLLRPLPSLPPAAVAAIAAAAAAAPGAPPVPTLHLPSALAFTAAAAARSASPLPVRLTGTLAHWPALAPPPHAAAPDRRWHSLAYLARAAGLRTVPVELGSDAHSGGYMAPGFDVRLWRLGDYLAGVVAPSVAAVLAGEGSEGPGSSSSSAPYMAQHALFDACPQLLEDICTPDYIYCFEGAAGSDDDQGAAAEPPSVSVRAWLGPTGTYSPLHCDATHGLLAQVVGVKRVRLLPPSAAPHLYAAPPPLQNTSLLPRAALAALAAAAGAAHSAPGSNAAAAAAALDAHPLLRQCQQLLQGVVLAPGDALFIPRGWWHEVEALSPSVSVSFWW